AHPNWQSRAASMAIVRPYEPPPDYPLDDRPSVYNNPIHSTQAYSNPAYRNPRLYSSPSTHSYDMIRTRQYPEIAGLSTQDRTPSLRSFSSRGPEPGNPEPGNNNRMPPHHQHQRHHQPQIQWSSSSTTSFHNTPFCPSRLNPNLRQAPSRAETERSSQVSGRLSSGDSLSPSPSLLLRSAVHSPLNSTQSNHYRKTLRKSCPELHDDSTREEERRRRRMKKKEERERKDLMKWRLDDVILWLQEIGEEEGASLLIGYEIRGEDVARWDEETLARFGIDDVATRRKILTERDKLVKKRRKERTSLFDIITKAAGDQVVVVETSLTVRDLIVSRNAASRCLTVQKVAGSNLPLEEDDCLLEINSIPGEQFTSPLMLTKLISDSGGRPIRFVVLRRARLCVHPEEEITRDSSSGVSSSSPIHHSHEKLYS
ncbi:hypothetical protein PENTCL1PPCAC_10613, partial [Pristionchus entomophagus]